MAGSSSGPLDKLYANNFVVGIILSACCFGVGLILSAVGYFTAKDPIAKKNATICLIISCAILALGLFLQFAGILGGLVGGR